MGVFDAEGGLFVVGNLPATYKPGDTECAYADTVVCIDFLVSNASTITLHGHANPDFKQRNGDVHYVCPNTTNLQLN